ncbi:MAG: hypothetical protein AB8E82_13750 [Aureispira sp.]
MRYGLLLCLLIGYWTVGNAQQSIVPPATVNKNLHMGYSLGLSYNFYSWYAPPNYTASNYSTGQVLNILPGLNTGLWIGDVEHWLLSLETEINFLPFAFSLNKYNGLGSLEIPTLAKIQLPLSKQQSLWTFLHVGLGVQWQRVDLYDRKELANYNQTYITWIGELGWQIAAVAPHKHRLRTLEYFVRVGAQVNALSVNTGLRLRFSNGSK